MPKSAGMDDAYSPKHSSTHEMATAIRDLTQKIVLGEHHMHPDTPDMVAYEIKKFLDNGERQA